MVYHLSSIARRSLSYAWLIVLLALPVLVSSEIAEQEYRLRIDEFHETLVQAMKIADVHEREILLAKSISPLFDTRRIAAVSLGRTWRSMAEPQRAEFVELLSELVVATYADRFDEYNDQTFITDAVTSVKAGYVVQTKLIRRNGEFVRLDYVFRDGGIFNVVADGVSDLSLRRADYNSIVKTEGYAALLTHMQDKIVLARAEK